MIHRVRTKTSDFLLDSTPKLVSGHFEKMARHCPKSFVLPDFARKRRVNGSRPPGIGADTPETVKSGSPVEAFGVDASDFTKQKIADANHRVRIAFDGEQLDRFGRTLAMVFLTMPNGQEVWLNELLIREGLAHARLDYHYSHGAKLSFAVAEVEARKHRRNLWRD